MKIGMSNNKSIPPNHSRVLLTVLGVLLVIAIAYLASNYYRQEKLQADLSGQIDQSVQLLNMLPTPAADLPAKLEAAQQSDQAAKSATIATGGSTRIVTAILKVADDCNLTAAPVTTDTWADKNIGDNVYKVMPVSLDVRGTLTDIIRFTGRIENKQAFPYLAVAELKLYPAGADGVPGTLAAGDDAAASLTLNIIMAAETSN